MRISKLSDSGQSTNVAEGDAQETEVVVLRRRAAELLIAQRDGVNRRIHSRMMSQARKVSDTEDVLSTALRRLDSLILSGRARARTDAELFALVHEVIERSIREKARNARRLKRREQIASELLAQSQYQAIVPSQELFQRLGQLARDEIDKEIAILRARGLRFHEIAESMGLPDTVVRKRWSRLKSRAEEMLNGGDRDDHRQ